MVHEINPVCAGISLWRKIKMKSPSHNWRIGCVCVHLYAVSTIDGLMG